MKHVLTALLFSVTAGAFGQASVAYYPFNTNLLTVSTNADRAVWLDARLQTNTPFGSLGTSICPMINVARRAQVNYYTGLGVRFNFLNGLGDRDVLEGYSLHVGVRIKPIPFVPNLRVAFELAPFAQRNFKGGNLQSFLGLAYQFSRRAKQ